MKHVVYQLTDAKVHAQPTPDGYQPPVLPAPLLLQWATGASAAGKRKHDPDDDDDSTYGGAEDENDDDGNSGASCGCRSRPLLCDPPPGAGLIARRTRNASSGWLAPGVSRLRYLSDQPSL